MKIVLIFIALVAPSLGARLPYIIGGNDSEYPGKWPWQGSISNWRGKHKCGCSIVSANWVITAAHCIDGSASGMEVILGAYDIKTLQDGEPTSFGVTEQRVHSDFAEDSSRGFPNDIGLLRLSEPAHLDSPFMAAVDLARPEDGDFSGWDHYCVITGWGDDGGWLMPNILQEAQVNALHNDFCRDILGDRITGMHVCVAYDNAVSACGGDSGGPLVCQDSQSVWRLVGLTSWGKSTCNPTYPSVYTRISYFRDWITENSDGEL